MSIRKVMMMFALMTGIVCAGHAQEVKNGQHRHHEGGGAETGKGRLSADGGGRRPVPRVDEEADVRPHDTAARSGGHV